MKSNAFYFSFLILVLAILSSCKKDSKNNDTTAVTDNALTEAESNKVITAVNSAALDNNVRELSGEDGLDSILPPCSTVTIDTLSAVRTITIDFGSLPCLCDGWDNRYREGKIIASWSGFYMDSGTVITIITQDYFQGVLPSEMNEFDFTKTVTNLGHNSNGNLHYGIDVSSALVTLYFGATISWTSQRDREWIEGESTLLPLDDKYSITGDASGTDRNGIPFTVTIDSAVIVAFVCPWIEKGVLEITHGNLPSATLDYGDGACDGKASITINGITSTFEVE